MPPHHMTLPSRLIITLPYLVDIACPKVSAVYKPPSSIWDLFYPFLFGSLARLVFFGSYFCWNYGGSVEHNRKWILRGSHCGTHFIVPSSFFTPYLVSHRYGSMYLSSLLMNRSPRAFARVPVLTRVNDSDTFILSQRTFGG